MVNPGLKGGQEMQALNLTHAPHQTQDSLGRVAPGEQLAISTTSNLDILGIQDIFVPWIFIIVMTGTKYGCDS